MTKYKDFILEEKTKKQKKTNMNDIIEKASKFFGRPISIINQDEYGIEIHGEAGIKKEELLEYLSNITDSRIKALYIKENNVYIEL